MESGLSEDTTPDTTLSELFDCAFALLKSKSNRDEYVYKSALTQKVLLGTHSLNTATMLTEFRVGSRKADVVVLNGTATAYEIKSERDNLSRLLGQVLSYLEVFASVNVIAGEKHIQSIANCVPSVVGIQVLSNSFSISTYREPVVDIARIIPSAVFDVLNLKESETVLRSLGIVIPKVPNTQKHTVLKELFLTLSPELAHRQMVFALKKHRSLRSLKSVLDSVPTSLYSAVLASKLRKKDYNRLVESLTIPVCDVLSWK